MCCSTAPSTDHIQKECGRKLGERDGKGQVERKKVRRKEEAKGEGGKKGNGGNRKEGQKKKGEMEGREREKERTVDFY